MQIIKKNFPQDYPEQYLAVIYAMSLTNTKNIYIEGTYSLRGFLYPSDVDCFEKVETHFRTLNEAKQNIKTKLQDMIQRIAKMKNIIIGKISIGIKDEKPMKWTPFEVLKGSKNKINILDAIAEPSLIKIDVIAYINSIYIDFSTTYQFFNNKTPINDFKLFQTESLDRDIKEYEKEGNYFKMAKRLFIKTKNKELLELFNGEDGLINQVISNIDTLMYIVENRQKIPFKNISSEIDGFINKINLLDNKTLVKDSDNIDMLLRQAENSTVRKTIINKLNTLRTKFDKIVQSDSKEYLKELKIL